MILDKILIEDYKSISNLEWNINDSISCLVGQNESGKSNLLEVFDFVNVNESKKLNYEIHTNRTSERNLEYDMFVGFGAMKLMN